MFEMIIGGAILSLVSAPAFIYLWKVAAEKKEKSLKKARATSKRRQLQNKENR